MPAHRIAFATIALLGAMILGAIQPSTSVGATRILAREGAKKLAAIPPSGGQPSVLFRLRKGALLSIGASSSGSVIAFVSRSWDKSDLVPVWTDRIWIMHRGSRARVVRTLVSPRTEAKNQIDSIVVSPDGQRILVNSRGGAAFMLRSNGTHFHRVTVPGYSFGVGGGGNSSGPEFTPDGRRIIGVFYPLGAEEEDLGGIGTTSINGGRIHFLRIGPFRYGVGIAFAPTISRDGRLIAFVTASKAGHRIVIMRRDGTNAYRLPGSQIPSWAVGNPCFSPSGNALAFEGQRMTAGGVVLNVAPSVVFTIDASGAYRQAVQREKAHRGARNLIWTLWHPEWGGKDSNLRPTDYESSRKPSIGLNLAW
jgi:WD40 repeat protein